MLQKSSNSRIGKVWLAPVFVGFWLASLVHAAFTTTVPVSERLAGDVAVSNFPVALALEEFRLLLTEPQVLFLGPERIGLRVAFQAYDHRPAQGVAISETGQAMLSGRVAYDAGAGEVLLHDPRLEQLNFDRDNAVTRQFTDLLRAAWSDRVSNPMRSTLPPHPYLQPFKANITDILYDGSHISLVLAY
ncbi:hypothetical protein E2F43_07080 [Seongchinamella unica]|uniref:DUF1439 domain-containing protein n=1 Tax=Seongchinamella unica TaxID=2547392 RepID=A0A4R5LWZ6_9GAMM|nr:hypothetical protein [Seongchinamella unica]TDG15980.1 hypothetical protein E2F43_07080 [Seongchinamella unica]